nr:putative capsular polysaccharide synthesis family protein [Desulfobacterales bacterium]
MADTNIFKSFLGLSQKYFAFFHANRWRFLPKREFILIYQMGKVGSTSVYDSLKKAGLRQPLFFVHFLSDDLPEYKQIHLDGGIVPAPYHIELGMALRRVIKKQRGKIHYKIISMVRDPIARQISDVFENPDLMGENIKNASGLIDKKKTFDYLTRKLASEDAFDYVFTWFDKELKAVFGIDVFSKPFDRDSGWTIYKGEHAEALIIRLEDLSGIGEDAITKFLETPHRISLVKANVRSDTKESEVYRYVKDIVRLDRSM